MKITRYLLLPVLAVLLIHCSPKTGSRSADSVQPQNTGDFRAMAPAAGPAPTIQIGEYDQFQLENGLTVIVVENHKIPRVSWQLFIDMPPMLEGEKVGMSDLAGSMMSRGTKSRSKAEIDQAIDYIGANFSTSSSGFFAASLSKHQDALLGILSEVLLKPSFPEAEFEKVVRQTMSGLAQAKNDANSLSSSVGSRIIFGEDHPYGEIETEEKIRNISVEDCRAYYEKYFKPNSAYLVVVGDINSDHARKQAKKYFGDWKRGAEMATPEMASVESPGDRSVSFINKDGAVQSVLRLSFPYQLKPGDPDAIKVSVMNTLLGGFFNSRVNLNLREDKGYTYGARTAMGTDQYVAAFSGTASVRNEVTDSAVHEFLMEIERLQNEPVSNEELDLVKSVVTGNFALSLERPQTIANFALTTARFNLPKDYYKNYLKQVEAITPVDIMETAKAYLQPDDLHIIVVGNEDAVAEKLLAFDDSGEIDFYDAEGNRLEKNAVALPADLTPEEVILNYLDKLGPKQQREGVKSVKMTYEIELMGTTLQMQVAQSRPDKFMMSMTAQGMEMTRQVINGDKVYVAQMGQRQESDEETAESLRSQAAIFEEEYNLAQGYAYELKGIESVNGENCYKLALTKPSGTESVFYSVESGLKLRSVAVQEQGGQTMTIVQEFKDYKAVDGILFPHTLVTSGAMPVPLEAKLVNIQVNPDLDASIFKVE